MLRVERSGATAIWTVDRPEAKNALDYATFAALTAAVADAKADATVRAAVIAGAGDVFVSGGDLRALRGRHAPADAEELSDTGHALTAAISALPFPVIAALTGPAIGGGAELAVACDLRVADPRARIAFKQGRLGVTTAWGSVPRLIALAGAGAAARLLFTGHDLDAEAAKAAGIVDAISPPGGALATAVAWAADVARASPAAVAGMKQLLREATRAAEDVRALERRLFVDTWTGPDHVDAVEAYFERRDPRWQI